MPGNVADRPTGWPMQALHRHPPPSSARQSRSFLALSYKPVRAHHEVTPSFSLPRRGQLMQILHHADLTSMAASEGLNLVRDNPSPDRGLAFRSGDIQDGPWNENLCTWRRRHRTADRTV